ncbi:oxygen-dependent protoporphyrinogen oxidase [Actinomadura hallensis]|uniref:Oxygen-dependent protoporphyrinogen oxidase n=1 Tax=Actinomadura hallensis TaxID=337895 RepID=A0A543I929_9ACTN|nr:NAD(P)/FAD-dependent oxidoreductase [Actinomadura hallensis]TQM67057.1 oxygen-dependent protoporphyrinogen oxidase [Actinomadura hallensis]
MTRPIAERGGLALDVPLPDVVVVGAGLAGLATAHALAQQGRTVRVLEAAGAVGGRMRTVREHGCLIDTGAATFPGRGGHPAIWRLVAALGLDRDPASVPPVRDALAVWRGGRARPNAGRPLGLVTGAGLSPRARLDLVRLRARLARVDELDPDHPERARIAEETLADLLRPYHPDLYDYLVHPMAAGFFGWDPRRSAAAPFAAHLAACGGSHTWRAHRDGMDALARALASRLDVTTDHPVTRVTCDGGLVQVESPRGTVTARAAVLAVPAPVAAGLYDERRPAAREFLAACGYTPMLRVSVVLDRPPVPRAGRPSYATLIPEAEDSLLGVITLEHLKHPGRAPGGRGLVTLVPSPRGCRELLGAPDRAVVQRLAARAARFLPGLPADPPRALVHRFRYGLPEATPRALKLRGAFAARPVGAVEYAGDWVSLRPCAEGAAASAALAAERIGAHLSPERRAAAGSRSGERR